MYPAFRIGDIDISAHSVFLALGVVIASLMLSRDSRRLPGASPVTPLLGLAAYLGGLIGARAAYLVENADWRDWWRAVLIHEPGLSWWGGALGAALLGYVYLRRTALAMHFRTTADLAAPYFCLVEAFVRVGCFLGGCCWGIRCDLPWAVRFPPGSWAYQQHRSEGLIAAGASESLPVHPVQLYMAVGLAGLFLGLRILGRRSLPPGVVAVAFGFGYGTLRFGLEFFRADTVRGFMGFTTVQWLCIALFIAAAIVAPSLRRDPPRD